MLSKEDAEQIVKEANEQPGWQILDRSHDDRYGSVVCVGYGRYTHSQRFWIREREQWFKLKQKIEELKFIADEAARMGIRSVGVEKKGTSLALEIDVPRNTPGFFGDGSFTQGYFWVGGLRRWHTLTRRESIEGSLSDPLVLDPPDPPDAQRQ